MNEEHYSANALVIKQLVAVESYFSVCLLKYHLWWGVNVNVGCWADYNLNCLDSEIILMLIC
jgi:hypothetical protein